MNDLEYQEKVFNEWGDLKYKIGEIASYIQNDFRDNKITLQNIQDFMMLVGELKDDIDIITRRTLDILRQHKE